MTVTESESVLTRAIRAVPAKFGGFRWQLSVLGIFLGIWAIFFAMNPSAWTRPMMYVAMLSTTSIMAIVAICETLSVISGEFDLSYPSLMALSAMVFTLIFLSTGNSVYALLGGIGVGVAAGFLNGLLVAKAGLPSLITTIGTLFLWRGVVKGITKGQISVPAIDETTLHSILAGRVWGIPIEFFWAIGIMILFWIILNRHKIGAHIYGVGDDEESSKTMGVNVAWTKFIVFTLMGLFAGLAGIMLLLEQEIFFPNLGWVYFLPIIATVFLGGTPPAGGEGTIFGSFMGALILGLLWVGVPAFISGLWRDMFFGLILVISLGVQAYLRGA